MKAVGRDIGVVVTDRAVHSPFGKKAVEHSDGGPFGRSQMIDDEWHDQLRVYVENPPE